MQAEYRSDARKIEGGINSYRDRIVTMVSEGMKADLYKFINPINLLGVPDGI
jgi:hypothetical protein